jgi:glycosyltransferase involved in cell wall biosynthesis
VRPVRVAFLAPNLDAGGAERQMLTLAAALPRSRFRASFILMAERGALGAEAEALGLPVYELGMDRARCRQADPRCAPTMLRAASRYLRLARNVDIVDAWLVPAYTFGGLMQPIARRPVLLAGRRNALNVQRSRAWYREAAGRLAMSQVRMIVANSQAAADEAVRNERIDPSRIRVIRNAVIPVEITPEERERLRLLWTASASDLVVGCVGNFHPGKGHEFLLDVAQAMQSLVPRMVFVCVGEGPLKPWLDAEIRRRGLESSVVLHTGEHDARGLYGAFDIAVQASESEGLPNCVLEAAVAGRAIVATNVGGTPEIITHGVDGILVTYGDRRGMMEALSALADSPELRQRIGSAAESRARDFSPERLAEQTGSLYLEILRDRWRDRERHR